MKLGELKMGQIFTMIEFGGRQVIYKIKDIDTETITVVEVFHIIDKFEETEFVSYFGSSCFDMKINLCRSIEGKNF